MAKSRRLSWGKMKPDMPGTSKKVARRRQKKELIKLAKRRKPNKRMTDAQWEELLESRPLLAELDQYIHSPFMIHWLRPLRDFQKEMIEGKSLSRQHSDWFRKVQQFYAKTMTELDNGAELSAADQWTLDHALRIERGPVSLDSKEAVKVCLAAYRAHGWVTKKMKKIILQKHGVIIDQLRDPCFKANDLVTLLLGRWWPHNRKLDNAGRDEILGLIAGEPTTDYSMYEQQHVVKFPVIVFALDGQIQSVEAQFIKIKARQRVKDS